MRVRHNLALVSLAHVVLLALLAVPSPASSSVAQTGVNEWSHEEVPTTSLFDQCRNSMTTGASGLANNDLTRNQYLVQFPPDLYIDLQLGTNAAQLEPQTTQSPVTLRFQPAAEMAAVVKSKMEIGLSTSGSTNNNNNNSLEVLVSAICNFLIKHHQEFQSRGVGTAGMVDQLYTTSLLFSNKNAEANDQAPDPVDEDQPTPPNHFLKQALQVLLNEQNDLMSAKSRAHRLLHAHLNTAGGSSTQLTHLVDELCDLANRHLSQPSTRHVGILLFDIGVALSEELNSNSWLIHAIYAKELVTSHPLQAKHQYELALRINPNNAALHHNYGVFLRDELDRQLATGSASGVHNDLFTPNGETAAIQGIWNVFEHAVTLDPCLQASRFALGDSLAKRGELDRAQTHMDAAVRCVMKLSQVQDADIQMEMRHDAITTRLRRAHVLLPQTYTSQVAMDEARATYMSELTALAKATRELCGIHDNTPQQHSQLNVSSSTNTTAAKCAFNRSPRDMRLSEGFGSIGYYLAFHGLGAPGYGWMVDTQARKTVGTIYAWLYPVELAPQPQFRRALLLPSELPQQPQQPQPLKHRNRLKVGFISSFFHEHSVGKLILGVLQSIDRTRFHVVVIALDDGPVDHVAREIRKNADTVLDLDTSPRGGMQQVLAHAKVRRSFRC
jgi:hypothetical protein